MQSIYNCIPETNHVSRVYSVVSHKSNPSSVPRGIVGSYSLCPGSREGGNICGGRTLMRVATTRAG